MNTIPTATGSPRARDASAGKPDPQAAGAVSGRRGRTGLIAKIIAIIIALAIWQFAAAGPLVGPGMLPSPIEVLQALLGLWTTGSYWQALGTTLRTWALGLGLCAVIGIPTGLLLGASKRATQSSRWVIDFLRSIPTIALLPLVLLLFGPTLGMELSLIVLAATWPLLIQSMYAVKQVEPLLKWVVRVFRISTVERLRFLWAPSVSLFVSTGMRLAATIGLLMTVSAEYIGGAPGIGLELSHMEQTLRRPEVFAYAITAGILGLLINAVVVAFQRRLLWWHPTVRGDRSS